MHQECGSRCNRRVAASCDALIPRVGTGLNEAAAYLPYMLGNAALVDTADRRAVCPHASVIGGAIDLLLTSGAPIGLLLTLLSGRLSMLLSASTAFMFL